MAIGAFQSSIQKHPAKGIAGDKATLNPFVYTDRNYIAHTVGNVPVVVGNFVWSSADNDTLEYDHGAGVFSAVAAVSGASALMTAPLGIVQRNYSYVNYDLLDGGTLAVPDNGHLNIVIRGDLYVYSTTAATAGEAVYATEADGSIQTAAPGGSIAGAVETKWRVVEGGAAGDPIVISNWTAQD